MDKLDLELKCCCCGKVLDTLETEWSITQVVPVALFSREPCQPCKLDLATIYLLRQGEREHS